MRLQKLSLLNFKNIVEAHQEFSPSINALVGDNGAGKTNVIDAIHYLSLSKSMFAMSDRQSVQHEAPFFVVDGAFSSDNGSSNVVVCSFSRQQAKGVKSLKCNGKEYDRFSEHVGVIPLVIVAPQDASLVYEGAEERRRFLNSFLSQLDMGYMRDLIHYNATLAQRNTLLKGRADESMLEIYDLQLSEKAQTIFTKRKEIIEQLQPLVGEYYKIISGDSEKVSLEYNSQLNGSSSLAELLSASRQSDLAMMHTTVGIHRDEIKQCIEGYPLRKYGSQGQQKSFLIALKLAQYIITSRLRGEKPILLLDDLFDKLDRHRVERLLQIVAGEEFGQIFITDCNRTRLEEILSSTATPYALYEVQGGEIKERK